MEYILFSQQGSEEGIASFIFINAKLRVVLSDLLEVTQLMWCRARLELSCQTCLLSTTRAFTQALETDFKGFQWARDRKQGCLRGSANLGGTMMSLGLSPHGKN